MNSFDKFLKKIIKAILNDIRMSKESDKTLDKNVKILIKKQGENQNEKHY